MGKASGQIIQTKMLQTYSTTSPCWRCLQQFLPHIFSDGWKRRRPAWKYWMSFWGWTLDGGCNVCRSSITCPIVAAGKVKNHTHSTAGHAVGESRATRSV